MKTSGNRGLLGLIMAALLGGHAEVQAAYTNLHAFAGGAGDGAAAVGALTLSGTTLYGLTFGGGASNEGVVFQMQADGTGYTNLHAFAGGAGDGAGSYGSLTLSGTTLYGLTFGGGASNKGVVFQLQADGTGYSNLHAFAGGAGDGAAAVGALTLSGTTLYGLTSAGGVSNKGVVFQLQADGTGYTNLHAFADGAGDGAVSVCALTLSGTELYGMTFGGGASSKGVVFRLQAGGTGYTNLHAFAGGAGDGAHPYIGTALTLSGTTLYGLTFMGGANNKGVVFQLQADGTGYTNLHEFAGGVGDGALPSGTLTLSGTTLYGMTSAGGASNGGVVFQLQVDGSGYTNLHEFAGGAGNGAAPFGALTLSGTTLYGMTSAGGASNKGVVFALTVPTTANFTLRPAQLFFQHADGRLASWLLATNGTYQSGRPLGSAGNWQLMTAGDVDGDGLSDLLFQNPAGDLACWLLDTNGAVRHVINWGQVGAWRLRAAADYAGEGHAQLFFQNPAGDLAFWRISTNGIFQSSELLAHAGGWQLRAAMPHARGVGADLCWQTAEGQVAIWRQAYGGAITVQFLGGTGGWVLSGAVDVDGDGEGDLLWQNGDGRIGGWLLASNGIPRAASSWGDAGVWKLKAAGR